jgi:hypothetical protein
VVAKGNVGTQELLLISKAKKTHLNPFWHLPDKNDTQYGDYSMYFSNLKKGFKIYLYHPI